MSASRKKQLRKEQEAPALTEREKQAKKEAKSLKRMTVIAVVVAIAMVLTIVAALVNRSGVFQRSLTAVTVENHKISPAEMNYFYVDAVNQFYNENQTYLSFLLDSSKALDQQIYNQDTKETWADQFLKSACTTASSSYALYDAAVAEGFTLTEEQQSSVDTTISNLKTFSGLYGYSSANAYLRAIYGTGSNVSSYKKYLTVQTIASAYATAKSDAMTYEDADLREYEQEDYDKYSSYTYRSFYIAVSNYTTDESTDAEKAEAVTKAETDAKRMARESKGDEESYTKLTQELCTESSKDTYADPDATLQKHILRDNTNSVIKEWLTDSARKAGDTTYIASTTDSTAEDGTTTTTTNGYYVVYFLEKDDNTKFNTVNVRHILISTSTSSSSSSSSDTVTMDEARAKVEELQAKYEEDPTEDNFAALAEENSADTGSASNGGLYENVEPHAMVDTFDAWIFDESRKPGDVGIVETSYGCHLMYFVGEGRNYRDQLVENDLHEKDFNDWYKGIVGDSAYTTGAAIGMVRTGITMSSQ